MTRAGPARTLGLTDRGHLAPGAAADITVYTDQPNRERMFAKPDWVFKDGTLVARQGEIVAVTQGANHNVAPEFDRSIERPLKDYFERYRTTRFENFAIDPDELCECGHRHQIRHACGPRVDA